MLEVLRFADVALRRLKRRVPRALFDLQRIVTADRHPRDPGCARRVVEADLFPRRVVREELRARDSRPLEVLPQAFREIARGRHVDHAWSLAVALKRLEQRDEVLLDWDA